jgi:hypothetical protein
MALRLSLRYGAGDVRWFERLDREDQIAVLALERIDAEARR